jgi:hypothetical protein
VDRYGLRPAGGAIGLLVAYTVGWALLKLGGPLVGEFISQHLALTPRRAIGPEPWQLITSGFFVDRLRMLLGLAVTLVFFGNMVEALLGARGLWKVWVAGIFGGALLVGLVWRMIMPDVALFVGEGAGTAVLVAYAVCMSGRRMLAFGAIEMGGGTIAWIWIGIQVVGALLDGIEVSWLGALQELTEMLGGGLAGWLVVRRGGMSFAGVRSSFDRLRLWRLRRRYRVLDGGRAASSTKDKRYLN